MSGDSEPVGSDRPPSASTLVEPGVNGATDVSQTRPRQADEAVAMKIQRVSLSAVPAPLPPTD